MKMGPGAELTDGLFDFVLIKKGRIEGRVLTFFMRKGCAISKR